MLNSFAIRSVLFAGALCMVAVTAAAQEYPTKAITIVSPYSAGGSADQVTRPIADRLARKLGRPVVVDNKTGAGGVIGTAAVASAPADGYTLVIGAAATIAILPEMRPLPYKVTTDLVPVAWLGDLVTGLAVTNGVGAKNMAQLLEKAKTRDRPLHYSSAGYGTTSNLRGELFAHLAGIKMVHVPYRSNADAIPDLVNGSVDIMFESIVFPLAKDNKVELVAILDDKRYPEFPNVPTMAEAGFPDFKIPLWYVLYAPAKTPRPVIEKLNRAIVEIASEPDFSSAMLAKGIRVRPLGLKDLETRMNAERETFKGLIHTLKIEMPK